MFECYPHHVFHFSDMEVQLPCKSGIDRARDNNLIKMKINTFTTCPALAADQC